MALEETLGVVFVVVDDTCVSGGIEDFSSFVVGHVVYSVDYVVVETDCPL
jgi:hypothetical protein